MSVYSQSRGIRSSKSRIQVVILIAVISLLGLFLYIQRDDTPIRNEIIDQNTIPSKRNPITDSYKPEENHAPVPPPSDASSSSSSANSNNCAYKVTDRLLLSQISTRHVIF